MGLMADDEGNKGTVDPTRASFPSQRTFNFVDNWLKIVVLITSGLWVAYTYFTDRESDRKKEIEQSKRESTVALINAQQPFLTKQLELYFETSRVVAILATAVPGSDEWRAKEKRFWELYWSELSVVEDGVVESAMVETCKAMVKYKLAPSDHLAQLTFEGATYDLAHALRRGFYNSWINAIPVNDDINHPMPEQLQAKDAKAGAALHAQEGNAIPVNGD
jgi:hypothetical protein